MSTLRAFDLLSSSLEIFILEVCLLHNHVFWYFVGLLCGHISAWYVFGWRKHIKVISKPADNNARDAITPLVVDAVNTDGGHHKQWYLEAIAEALQIALPPHDDGIAP